MPKYPRPNSYTGKQSNQNWTGVTRFANSVEVIDATNDQLAISPATLSAAVIAIGGVTTLTGNFGGARSPTLGNINIVGTGGTTVTGAGSTLSINVVGGDITWSAQAGPGPTLLLADTGSFCTGTSTLDLPVTPTNGSVCRFVITTAALTVIVSGNGATILPDTGSAAAATWTSTNQLGGALDLVYSTAGNIWYTMSSTRTWT